MCGFCGATLYRMGENSFLYGNWILYYDGSVCFFCDGITGKCFREWGTGSCDSGGKCGNRLVYTEERKGGVL